MIRKIFNILSISLGIILISISLFMTKMVYIKKLDDKTKIRKEIFKIVKDNEYDFNTYLGYIVISSLNIKKGIVFDTTDYVLNQNVVGIHKTSAGIDDSFGNVILAGHNNIDVFKNLLKIKIDDEIEIISKSSCYKYKVYQIDIYNLDEYSYFNKTEDKILTLITCYTKDKRFVVRAHLV